MFTVTKSKWLVVYILIAGVFSSTLLTACSDQKFTDGSADKKIVAPPKDPPPATQQAGPTLKPDVAELTTSCEQKTYTIPKCNSACTTLGQHTQCWIDSTNGTNFSPCYPSSTHNSICSN